MSRSFVRQKRKGTKTSTKLTTDSASPMIGIPREVQEPIGPGDVVTLPDGAVAAVEKIVGTDAYVIEWTKQIGRGPWIYALADLTRVA